MTGQDALWSALEVRTQAEQCAGQVTVWEALEDVSAEPCACADLYDKAGRPREHWHAG